MLTLKALCEELFLTAIKDKIFFLSRRSCIEYCIVMRTHMLSLVKTDKLCMLALAS